MLTFLLLFQATLASASINSTLPGEGKGTIGLVCVDSAGVTHFWTSRARRNSNDKQISDIRTDFEICIDQVVQNWNVKAAVSREPQDLTCVDSGSTDPQMNNLIGGFSTYKKALDSGANPQLRQ
jgi:hypothetical protein